MMIPRSPKKYPPHLQCPYCKTFYTGSDILGQKNMLHHLTYCEEKPGNPQSKGHWYAMLSKKQKEAEDRRWKKHQDEVRAIESSSGPLPIPVFEQGSKSPMGEIALSPGHRIVTTKKKEPEKTLSLACRYCEKRGFKSREDLQEHMMEHQRQTYSPKQVNVQVKERPMKTKIFPPETTLITKDGNLTDGRVFVFKTIFNPWLSQLAKSAKPINMNDSNDKDFVKRILGDPQGKFKLGKIVEQISYNDQQGTSRKMVVRTRLAYVFKAFGLKKPIYLNADIVNFFVILMKEKNRQISFLFNPNMDTIEDPNSKPVLIQDFSTGMPVGIMMTLARRGVDIGSRTIEKFSDNPRKPPKKWWDKAMKAGLSPALAGWNWYHNMSPEAREAALAKEKGSRIHPHRTRPTFQEASLFDMGARARFRLNPRTLKELMVDYKTAKDNGDREGMNRIMKLIIGEIADQYKDEAEMIVKEMEHDAVKTTRGNYGKYASYISSVRGVQGMSSAQFAGFLVALKRAGAGRGFYDALRVLGINLGGILDA